MTRIILNHELGGNKEGDTIEVTPGAAELLIAGEYATPVDGADPGDGAADEQVGTKPPKNGSLEAWKGYAESLDIIVPDDAKRDDVVNLVETYENA